MLRKQDDRKTELFRRFLPFCCEFFTRDVCRKGNQASYVSKQSKDESLNIALAIAHDFLLADVGMNKKKNNKDPLLSSLEWLLVSLDMLNSYKSRPATRKSHKVRKKAIRQR